MANDFKTNAPMSVDSALWYIESTLNVTYGDASYAMEATVVDSSFVEVAVVNGQVSFDEVEAAYNTFYKNVKAQYDGVANTDKQFIYADAEVVETGLKTTTTTLKLTAVVGEGPINPTAFGATDYWNYCCGNGKCGSYYGQGIGSDAAQQIQTKVHMRKPVPSGYYYYVAPFANVEIHAWDYDNPNDVVHDNLYDYMMFHQYDTDPSSWPNFHDCLNPNEMNFYLLGTEQVIYNIEKPQGLNFINVELYGDALYTSNSTTLEHTGTIHYGTLVVSSIPPEDL